MIDDDGTLPELEAPSDSEDDEPSGAGSIFHGGCVTHQNTKVGPIPDSSCEARPRRTTCASANLDPETFSACSSTLIQMLLDGGSNVHIFNKLHSQFVTISVASGSVKGISGQPTAKSRLVSCSGSFAKLGALTVRGVISESSLCNVLSESAIGDTHGARAYKESPLDLAGRPDLTVPAMCLRFPGGIDVPIYRQNGLYFVDLDTGLISRTPPQPSSLYP